MLKKLKNDWKRLKEGEHGARFREFYDYRQENRSSKVARVAMLALALVLIVGGAAIGWLPGPGGFVAIFGLAILAQEYRPLAAALDWIERLLVRLWRGFRNLSVASQSGIVTMALVISAGVVYTMYLVVLA